MTARGEFRLNAALSVALAAALAWLVNALASEHLALRRDVSEDRLYGVDPATREVLAELEDLLQVQAYFTGDARHGPVQIAKGRLVRQLRELEDLAGGRMHTSFLDPNDSSEVRVEAVRQGIVPVPVQAVQGTSALTQEVYLGLVLRYRGRERTIPFALPQTFEYTFVSELDRLLREERVTVGFLAGDATLATAEPRPEASFSDARALVGRDHEVVLVRGTAEGVPIPEEVGVLVVAGPVALHPRAVWAVEQFVQRGGRALLLVDAARTEGDRMRSVRTGLEGLLAAWGAPLAPGHVWDHGSSNSLRTREGGSLQYPYWPRVRAEALDPDHPAVARLPGADLFWCHAFGDAADELPGVERVVLAESSERAWVVPQVTTLAVDGADLEAKAAELLAQGDGRALPLVLALGGRLPGAFERAPAPRDPIDEALWADAVRAAREAGEEPPPYPAETTDETSVHGEGGQVVVVGDADWATNGETLTERNRMLLSQLVDWLALDEAYRALRARVPRDRRIADFLDEEREVLGVGALDGTLAWERAEEVSRLEGRAQARAARRRWLSMGAATGGALGALLALGALGHVVLARGSVREGAR